MSLGGGGRKTYFCLASIHKALNSYKQYIQQCVNLFDLKGFWLDSFFRNPLEQILNTKGFVLTTVYSLLFYSSTLQEATLYKGALAENVLLIQIRDSPFLHYKRSSDLLPYMSNQFIHLQCFDYSLVPEALGCPRSLTIGPTMSDYP